MTIQDAIFILNAITCGGYFLLGAATLFFALIWFPFTKK